MLRSRRLGVSILIVHPDRKTQRIVQRILGVTGYRIDIADELDHAARVLADAPPVLIVLDAALALGEAARPFFATAKARGVEACMTLLAGPALAQVPVLLGLGAVTNLLVHPMPVLAEELTITAHKLIRNDLFGADKYLLWGTDLHEMTMTRSTQRGEQVARIAEHVRAIGQSTRVASMAMLVTDELLSNAVHNAPIDAAGEHYRRDVPRDHELELDAQPPGAAALGLRRALLRDRGHRSLGHARSRDDPALAREDRRARDRRRRRHGGGPRLPLLRSSRVQSRARAAHPGDRDDRRALSYE